MMCVKWGDKIRLEMAKLASVPSVLCSFFPQFSPLLRKGKHFPFLYFKRTVVIFHDYTGNRNFYRHNSVVVLAIDV